MTNLGLVMALPMFAAACASAAPATPLSPPLRHDEPEGVGITTMPIHLDALPSGSLPDPISMPNPPPVGPAPGAPTDELLLEPWGKGPPGAHFARVKDAPIATIWHNGIGQGAATWPILCGALANDPYLGPMRWATLKPEGHAARLVVTDGWIDHDTCAVTVVTRSTVLAAPLVPGVLYAFRDGERLVLLFPGTSDLVASEPISSMASGGGAIGHAALHFGDAGVSFVAAVDPSAWVRALDPSAAPAIAAKLLRVDVGIEVTRSSSDPSVFAMAYVMPPKPQQQPIGDPLFRESIEED